jgi:hypothetical protein
MESIFNYLNSISSICISFATVIGTWIAVKTYKKQIKYNLTYINVNIIDDAKRNKHSWYIKYRLINCQKTIDKAVLHIIVPFESIESWRNDQPLHTSNKSKQLEFFNISSGDNILLCLNFSENKSNELFNKIKDKKNLDSIINIDLQGIRLQSELTNIFQLDYA